MGAAPARDDGVAHLGLSEAGAVRGDANVAGHRQLATAAQRIAVDRGDHRLRQLVEPLEDTVAEPGEVRRGILILQSVQLRDVGARHERLRPRTGHDNDANRLVAGDVVNGAIEGGQGRPGEGC